MPYRNGIWVHHRSRMLVLDVYVHQERLHGCRRLAHSRDRSGEAVIIAGANGYLSLAKSDHKRGGITFESAKASNFVSSDEESRDSPAI